MTLRHIVLLFTTLLVVFSEGRAVGIERVAKKNGVFELADIGAVGKKVLGILEKAPVKADIISEFGVKIQSNVDDILAVFPNEPTHLFYQKLAGRSDEIHEALLNNVGDIGLRSADDLTVFFDDIAASGADLMEAFATNPNLVKSWEVLFEAGYVTMRKNPVSLQKLLDLLSNPNLVNSGLSKDILKRTIAGNRGVGAGAVSLDDLTDGLNSLVNSGTNFSDYIKLVGDLEKGGKFAEGAGWIQKYIVRNTSEFIGKNLEFEVGVISGRVDLKTGNILYEFKSVSSLPPGSFASQVARDLQNVDDLSQMKWYFDGSKLPSGITQIDKDAMLAALDNMILEEATIMKFVSQPPYTVGEVVNKIEDVFNQIFQVK